MFKIQSYMLLSCLCVIFSSNLLGMDLRKQCQKSNAENDAPAFIAQPMKELKQSSEPLAASKAHIIYSPDNEQNISFGSKPLNQTSAPLAAAKKTPVTPKRITRLSSQPNTSQPMGKFERFCYQNLTNASIGLKPLNQTSPLAAAQETSAIPKPIISQLKEKDIIDLANAILKEMFPPVASAATSAGSAGAGQAEPSKDDKKGEDLLVHTYLPNDRKGIGEFAVFAGQLKMARRFKRPPMDPKKLDAELKFLSDKLKKLAEERLNLSRCSQTAE